MRVIVTNVNDSILNRDDFRSAPRLDQFATPPNSFSSLIAMIHVELMISQLDCCFTFLCLNKYWHCKVKIYFLNVIVTTCFLRSTIIVF